MKFDRAWLDLPDEQFKKQIDDWFKKMSGIGYLTSTRKEHVQTAVDTIAMWAEARDGFMWTHNARLQALGGLHMKQFRAIAPAPSLTLKDKINRRLVLEAKQTMLEEKAACLKHWQKTMWTDPDAFLQGPKDLVKDTIEQMLSDAKEKVGSVAEEPWMKVWHGFEVEKEGKWSNERFRRAVSGEVKLRAGIEETGEVTVEWKSIKATFKQEAFVGIRGSASAKAAVSAKGLRKVDKALKGSAAAAVDLANLDDPMDLTGVGISASAEASIEIGVKLTAQATVEVGEIFEASGKAEAFAGAMASAQAKLVLSSKEGIAISASAEAFAGAKLSAEGEAKVKWRGREIWSIKANAALTAGIGAKAEFSLSIPTMGPTELSLSAGLTLGVGTELGTSMAISMTNLKLSGEQWLYEQIQALATRGEHRYEMLGDDLDNKALATQASAEIDKFLVRVRNERAALEALQVRDRGIGSAAL